MKVFLEALPIIGKCLVGIFGVTALIILVVYLLNKFSAWVETKNNNKES